TLAEGIEEEAQVTALLEDGCKQGQGYLMSRPLTAEDLRSFVESRMPSRGGKVLAPIGAGSRAG
ncbi:MAG TPA: hypothetical protein VGP46_08295, partial [Acidimicrobiales bacterium]|nr:hypothetical protein [Acidimicrobiales bacterium]